MPLWLARSGMVYSDTIQVTNEAIRKPCFPDGDIRPAVVDTHRRCTELMADRCAGRAARCARERGAAAGYFLVLAWCDTLCPIFPLALTARWRGCRQASIAPAVTDFAAVV